MTSTSDDARASDCAPARATTPASAPTSTGTCAVASDEPTRCIDGLALVVALARSAVRSPSVRANILSLRLLRALAEESWRWNEHFAATTVCDAGRVKAAVLARAIDKLRREIDAL